MNNLNGVLDSIKAGEFGLTEFSISILFSLSAGVICMLLYRLYFGNAYDRNESLTRSFVIIAPSICAMFWAIQYSLPLSLGLLGALSFVRFRTPIKKPEDIAFILLVIALSLLSSVFRFFAATILLGIVALIVLVKAMVIEKRLPFLNREKSLTAFVSTNSTMIEEINTTISKTLETEFGGNKGYTLILKDVIQKDVGCSLRYSIHFELYLEDAIPRIFEKLNQLEALERVEVFHGKADI